ncbi:alkyl hydroperoxide reductase subunit C [Roseovarius sp. A-2]|uniref:redoxin domain-containing protein n=1 Tax=Roseovarius sp. A-2 TaxID=1570360 RepID=UPI0009B565A8|nr:redoxin domain-containing protein [Roseovarius sp. A-2]GAW34200.1 alkyl hydroperoxide reductase subunit C [Roseovarius sp. A-2]
MKYWSASARAAENWVEVPRGYRKVHAWTPQIGDIFPNFNVQSTQGAISFHNWAEGEWIYLFSHPSAFTPICTTELASMAMMLRDFEDAGISVAALSMSGQAETARWVADVEDTFGLDVDFPVMSDPGGRVSREMGLIHPKENAGCTIRKSFIIDPSLKLRMMFDYPALVGRSSEEALRAILALQATDRTSLGVPADWQPDDDLLARASDCGDADLDVRYGSKWTRMCDYLKVVHAGAVN